MDTQDATHIMTPIFRVPYQTILNKVLRDTGSSDKTQHVRSRDEIITPSVANGIYVGGTGKTPNSIHLQVSHVIVVNNSTHLLTSINQFPRFASARVNIPERHRTVRVINPLSCLRQSFIVCKSSLD